tara:strand:- start:1192 stop:1446 length:255 start_codon:yes stop_codon:yes gene_type:complete
MIAPVRLVETATLQKIRGINIARRRQSNGENLVRIVLLCFLFFVLVQVLSTPPPTEAHQPQPRAQQPRGQTTPPHRPRMVAVVN